MPHISNKEFRTAVERNITTLFKTFHYKTGYFLSERDVQSYLYSLLINDEDLKITTTFEGFSTPNIEAPKTLLVHADMKVHIRRMKNDRRPDLTILPPHEAFDYNGNFDNAIGIEIKFNRRAPARKEPSNILEDVKKCADYSQGYILWLNWDRPIGEEHLKKVKERVAKYENVRLFYLDVYSNPVKTNIPDL
jgi:hypothetical protein